ncbi:MAG: peroxiredoxin [Solirubrobacterales bacterium]
MSPKLKSSPLPVGSKAPDFTLPDQDGNDVRLYDALENGPVVVYFYPKAFTDVCTAEACAFRDNHSLFKDAGADVIGISTDSIETQKSFHDKFHLNYPVLSDPKAKVHGMFGVRNGGGFGLGFALNDRLTFVLDSDGVVQDVFGGLLVARPHIEKSLGIIQSLIGDKSPST